MANKVVEVVVVAKIKEDTTTSMTKVEIVTQILLKEGTALLDLKISHIYNVFDEKKMNIISQNVEQNCRMNKISRQTLLRYSII